MSKSDDWTVRALCSYVSETDKQKFFSSKPEDIKDALDICNECPVRLMCLQEALDRPEVYGIRGGVEPEEIRRDTSTGLDGKRKDFPRGPVRCPNCGPNSTKYLFVVEKERNKTKVGCYNCGLQWHTKKIISKSQSSW